MPMRVPRRRALWLFAGVAFAVSSTIHMKVSAEEQFGNFSVSNSSGSMGGVGKGPEFSEDKLGAHTGTISDIGGATTTNSTEATNSDESTETQESDAEQKLESRGQVKQSPEEYEDLSGHSAPDRDAGLPRQGSEASGGTATKSTEPEVATNSDESTASQESDVDQKLESRGQDEQSPEENEDLGGHSAPDRDADVPQQGSEAIVTSTDEKINSTNGNDTSASFLGNEDSLNENNEHESDTLSIVDKVNTTETETGFEQEATDDSRPASTKTSVEGDLDYDRSSVREQADTAADVHDEERVEQVEADDKPVDKTKHSASLNDTTSTDSLERSSNDSVGSEAIDGDSAALEGAEVSMETKIDSSENVNTSTHEKSSEILSDFYAKASEAGSDSFEIMHDAASRMGDDDTRADLEAKEYSGLWGVSQTDEAANMDLLFLLFEKQLKERCGITVDRAGQEAVFPLPVGAGIDEQEAAEILTKIDERAKDPSKSANDVFVEGLDDIHKLFEEVDTPDELDVGAAGSSIHEVLMGQGRQILLKRISIALRFVRRTCQKAVDKIRQQLEGEDGDPLITKESIQRQIGFVWRGMEHTYDYIVDFFDGLFDGNDDDDGDFELDFATNFAERDADTSFRDATGRPHFD